MKLKYVVAGTGRSGTVFMARLLTSVGISCGHESVFDFGGIQAARRRLSEQEMMHPSIISSINYNHDTKDFDHVDWHPDIQTIIADSSYMAAPFLRDELLQGTSIIHAVRHPVKVINSFCNLMNYFGDEHNPTDMVYHNFIYGFLPQLKEDMPQYDRAALYYILWNQMIENCNPDFFFRVEDNSDELLEFLGISVADRFADSTINTHWKPRTKSFSWPEVKDRTIRNNLVDIGKKYGYDMSLDHLLI